MEGLETGWKGKKWPGSDENVLGAASACVAPTSASPV
jgi:hypothetical protein